MHSNITFPERFLSSMADILPSHLSMEDFTAACQRPLRKSIRVNTLKLSIQQFQQIAHNHGWQLTPIPWCQEGFWIDADESSVSLGNTAEHMAGLFYIQEASSMMPVSALFHHNTAPLEAILDTAAAPGSKTTQIAALMENQGILVANEYSASRVKVLHANIERCGIRNTALTNYDGCVFGAWLPEYFDAVLLDAPCSGEGTIRKDADALKNWSHEAITSIATTQKALIESAFHALKPGGILVYSTCTLSREENQDVCAHLKHTFGDTVTFDSLHDLFPEAKTSLTEEGFLHIWPQMYDCEGFFVARIRKNASVTPPDVTKRLGKFPFRKVSRNMANTISEALYNDLGVTLPTDARLWERDKDIWLFPTALEPLLSEMRFSRMGIKIAETHKKGFRWQHQVATTLVQNDNTHRVDIGINEAREWFMGRDIRPETVSGSGEVIVCFDNAVIGLGKWVGNRIKNALPRELVRDKTFF
ncbi:16S rRNA (cytosine(1407)-C(5))-methyltransferase RsmF [Vibrio zhugei]|uniref:Ribosomal RNA small subunit methyltransferase F n=1 Tax=Vibrio zhugei TaxID=2479546 RepID=A0ABV7C9V0_9VIBR|nr:16S rRNA (cytosine(1407)-C(5))-methyltransferase RsmF [Vibrio zhugei]